jgi:deoxyadenosine/deoxycytidine kinase
MISEPRSWLVTSLKPQATNLPGSFGRRIEILGMFGSGKTTFANRLVKSGVILLAERHEDNPFWGNQYAIERVGFLAYDLAFLLQHAGLVLRSPESRPVDVGLCDWSFETDFLWASMRLGHDFGAYEKVYRQLLRHVGPPLGWIYLPQPTDVICTRLRKRGRAPEAHLAQDVSAAVKKLDGLIQSLPAAQVLWANDDTSVTELQEAIRGWNRLSADS